MAPNRILTSRPAPGPRAYVMANPRWLRVTFRLALLLVGPLALYLVLSSSTPLPLPAVLIAVAVAVVTFPMAVWARPWSRFDLFIADDEGIAFPANDLLATSFKSNEDTRWLLVPWANIDAIRVAVTQGERSRCVAFDVKANAADISPPMPAKTVAALLALRKPQ
jgi:hypothetical protein